MTGGSRSRRPPCFYFLRIVMTAAMMDPVAMMIPEMISMLLTSFLPC
ncbi:hypothetical protein AB0387_24315 [Streptomyces sp. NPDC089173]